MYHFEYVNKETYKPEKQKLIAIINEVQDVLSDYFTFEYKFVGSSSRNMVTCDYSQNIGYDFDVNIIVNDEEEQYSAKDLKTTLMNGFNFVNQQTEYGNCEDSTKVFTIKVVDTNANRISHSCDFAIVHDCSDGRRQIVHYNKQQGTYSWVYKSKGYYELPLKVQWCKDKRLWDIVREKYLANKNKNRDLNKHSSSIFAETINNICVQYGYFD